MKKVIIYLLLSLTTCYSFAQNCGCDKLLEGGLYSFTKMTNTGSFNSDLRTYYLSDQFKADMQSGKWGGSLSIPIEGNVLSIGANSSDQQWSEWRNTLLSATSLSISSNVYQTMFSSIPNTNLYDAYTKCTEICTGNGVSGFIQGENIETDDQVVFTIYYKPSSPADSMPKVINFNVDPAGSIINGGLVQGQRLSGFTVLVVCRRSSDKDLILTLQTDRGSISSKASAIDNVLSGKELPIGTVITSILNFEQFNVATGNNDKSPGGIWTSQKSKWAPCDGRPIPQSKYQTLTNQNSIPDLRGMFLRGLNMFDPYQPVPAKNPNDGDPDNRTVAGQGQGDGFKAHNHGGGNHSHTIFGETGAGGGRSSFITGDRRSSTQWDGNPGVDNSGVIIQTEGIQETRPKNVSVYYYIKIN